MSDSPHLRPVNQQDELQGAQDGAAEAVQAVAQFLRIVYYRKTYVITCLVVAALLGGL